MSKINPNQYDCDSMEQGDMIWVRPRSFLYKIYRNLFKKNLLKIKVKESFDSNIIKEFYQEDCILMYAWDLLCIQSLKNTVPYTISNDAKFVKYTTKVIPEVIVGLSSIQFKFKRLTFTIPLYYIDNAIKSNNFKLKTIKDTRMIRTLSEDLKYKADYYKNKVVKDNIKEWITGYCNICGEPLKLVFNENDIDVISLCNCGQNKTLINKMSYDELATYIGCELNECAQKVFWNFWFKEV